MISSKAFDKNLIIKNIKFLLAKNHVTQTALSNEIHFSQSYISKILNQQLNNLPTEFLYNIAQYFHISMDDLMCCDLSNKNARIETYYSLSDACCSLAEFFKSYYAGIAVSEIEHNEQVYADAIDPDTQTPLGFYYLKANLSKNRYPCIFFPNYIPIQTSFSSIEESEEYQQNLTESGNMIDSNIALNDLLSQLTDIITIKSKTHMSYYSFSNLIDEACQTVIAKYK